MRLVSRCRVLIENPSEEFADPPPQGVVDLVPQIAAQEGEDENDPVVPLSNPPRTLMEWAVLILNTPNPILKVCFALVCEGASRHP